MGKEKVPTKQDKSGVQDLVTNFEDFIREEIEETFQEWCRMVFSYDRASWNIIQLQLQRSHTRSSSKWIHLSEMRRYMFRNGKTFAWASASYYKMSELLGQETFFQDEKRFKRELKSKEEENCYFGVVAAATEMSISTRATEDLADVALSISKEPNRGVSDSNAAVAMITEADIAVQKAAIAEQDGTFSQAPVSSQLGLGKVGAISAATGVVVGAGALAVEHADAIETVVEQVHTGGMVAATFGGHVSATMGLAIDTGLVQTGMALLQIRAAGKTSNPCHKKVKLFRAGAFSTSVAAGLIGAALLPVAPVAGAALLAVKGIVTVSVVLTSEDLSKISNGRVTSLEDRFCDEIDDIEMPAEFRENVDYQAALFQK